MYDRSCPQHDCSQCLCNTVVMVPSCLLKFGVVNHFTFSTTLFRSEHRQMALQDLTDISSQNLLLARSHSFNESLHKPEITTAVPTPFEFRMMSGCMPRSEISDGECLHITYQFPVREMQMCLAVTDRIGESYHRETSGRAVIKFNINHLVKLRSALGHSRTTSRC